MTADHFGKKFLSQLQDITVRRDAFINAFIEREHNQHCRLYVTLSPELCIVI